MARIQDILALGGAQHAPLDITMKMLTHLPDTAWESRCAAQHGNVEVRRGWTIARIQANHWQCVCQAWRQCYREHLSHEPLVVIRHEADVRDRQIRQGK